MALETGDFVITWDWGYTSESVNLNAKASSATVGIQSIETGLSKNVMSIPVPNANNIGFDIGFTEGDDWNIYAVLTDGATKGSTYNKLRRAIKYKKHVNLTTGKNGDPFGNTSNAFKIEWQHDDWLETQYGLINSFNATFTSGHGNIVNIRMSIKIVTKSGESSDYEE